MLEAAVVEYHVHDDFYAFLVCLVAESAIFLVGAEAWVYAVIVCCSVAMVSALGAMVGRVVLKNRSKPQCRYAEFLEIVEMLAYALKVASVAQAGLRAVVPVGTHAIHLVIVCPS